MQTTRHLVLLGEDNRDLRSQAAVSLRRSGYAVLEAGDALEAVELAKKHGPDLAVLDSAMPVVASRIDGPVIRLSASEFAGSIDAFVAGALTP